MNTTINRLVIAETGGTLPENIFEQVQHVLFSLGFIGDSFQSDLINSGQCFYTGERFLDHLTFLGCSPSIALSPEDGDDFCFIHLQQMGGSPVLQTGSNTGPPRCRQCQQVKDNWSQLVDSDEGFCDRCDLNDRQVNLAWRRTAAFSRFFITIAHVYPHEAVPSPNLLAELSKVAGIDWDYAYLQS